jgi:DNA polymerase-3 subunit beta
MDFTVAKRDLLKLARRAQAVADKKSTMPVLANVLLDAHEGTVTVSGTDLFLAVQGQAPADVKRAGSVAVPAKDLFDRVSMMPEGPLRLVSENGTSTVLRAASSARRYTLHGVPEPAEGSKTITITAETMSVLIARTQFSISPDDTRPNLNSALFEQTGERVRMVTTDGHRLSKMEIAVPEGSPDISLLLPLKAVAELKRLADEARAETTNKDTPVVLELVHSGPNAFFKVAQATFSVKLVDAQFPAYQQVIPQRSSQKARIPRAAFADALKAVSLAATSRTGGVRVSLSPGLLRITSESPESGDGLDEVPMEYDGPEVTIGFNAKYFQDVLSAMDGEEEVVLEFSGELDPAVLRPGSTGEHAGYLAVVMPMRILVATALFPGGGLCLGGSFLGEAPLLGAWLGEASLLGVFLGGASLRGVFLGGARKRCPRRPQLFSSWLTR